MRIDEVTPSRALTAPQAVQTPTPKHNKPHKDEKNFIYDSKNRIWWDKRTQKPASGLAHETLMKAYDLDWHGNPKQKGSLGKAVGNAAVGAVRKIAGAGQRMGKSIAQKAKTRTTQRTQPQKDFKPTVDTTYSKEYDKPTVARRKTLPSELKQKTVRRRKR